MCYGLTTNGDERGREGKEREREVGREEEGRKRRIRRNESKKEEGGGGGWRDGGGEGCQYWMER